MVRYRGLDVTRRGQSRVGWLARRRLLVLLVAVAVMSTALSSRVTPAEASSASAEVAGQADQAPAQPEDPAAVNALAKTAADVAGGSTPPASGSEAPGAPAPSTDDSTKGDGGFFAPDPGPQPTADVK